MVSAASCKRSFAVMLQPSKPAAFEQFTESWWVCTWSSGLCLHF
jgi:hypothetical protein